nr:class I SAM-dependent methyltransferase [Halomicroarcula sp. SHR3]
MLVLGTGSGYAARALSEATAVGRAIGFDAAPGMARAASTRTDDSHDRMVERYRELGTLLTVGVVP